MAVRNIKGITSIRNTYVENEEKKQYLMQQRKKKLYRRLIAFSSLFLIITILLVSTLISQTSRLEEKQRQKAQLEHSLAKLEKKQVLLKEELAKLKDDDYVAKLAREKYFLSDKGEIIFYLPKEKKKEKDVE
ncbi:MULTISPECIES: FtsB family cell division protein [Bacillus]|jgi:cell division protein DivIC|uniref:Cell division protein DIVIC n=1 Tax=Bacillus smithii 7_3_47FAA TaxID=665952 RepID=G9QGL9_9BACI|nr:septum formation initiator family protein [Bacillus smithii]EHL79682.1 hypothetical protein HMPREF1015_02783 [Bacillus smithii 7_3_47FAA]